MDGIRGEHREARIGLVLVTASAVAFSTAGYFTRKIGLDAWTTLLWRCAFGGLTILAAIAWRERRGTAAAFADMGAAGVATCLCSALATICFINAPQLTAVADVLVIGATAPFATAAIAWGVGSERPLRRTLVASAVALVGVAITVGGNRTGGGLAGSLLALAMTLLLAAMMVIIRARRSVSMLPGACASAFLAAALVAPLAAPASSLTGADLAWLALFGTTQFGTGLLLVTIGTRLISATRSALIGILDVPLAPLWVWIAFGEVPAPATVVGGLLVVGAVGGEALAAGVAGRSRADRALGARAVAERGHRGGPADGG